MSWKPCISVANTVVFPTDKPDLHPTSDVCDEAMWQLACVFNVVPTNEEQNRDLICFFQMLVDSWSPERDAYELHRYMDSQCKPITNDIKDTQAIRIKCDREHQSLILQLFNTTDPLMQKWNGPLYSFNTINVAIPPVKVDKMQECGQILVDLLTAVPANQWRRPQNRTDSEGYCKTYTLTELARILIERDPEIKDMNPTTMKTAIVRTFEDDPELSDRYLQPDETKRTWYVPECDIPTIEQQTIIKQAKERYKKRNVH